MSAVARPRLKPFVEVVPLGPDNVILRAPGVFARYHGEGVATLLAILAHLDGSTDAAGVARRARLDLADVNDALEALAADHVVEDAALDDAHPLPDDERARFAESLALFSHLTTNAPRALSRLREATVQVAGDGLLADSIAQHLRALGVGNVVRKEDITRLTNVSHLVVASGRRDAFLAANDASLAHDVPWTAARIDGLDAFVGPTVIPRQTACWRCYDLRTKGAHSNMDRLMAYDAGAPIGAPTRPALPTFDAIVAAWTAQAVAVSVARVTLPPLAGKVLVIDLLGLRATPHRVLRIPRCPACCDNAVPDVDRYALEPVGL